MEISYQYSEKQRIIKKQPEILNIQTGEGREVGQPECNFGPQYKKYTLVRLEIKRKVYLSKHQCILCSYHRCSSVNI